MGKRLLNLYVEDSEIELAKAKGINLSALFREVMTIENKATKTNNINGLKKQLAETRVLLAQANEKITKLNEKVKRGTRRLVSWG